MDNRRREELLAAVAFKDTKFSESQSDITNPTLSKDPSITPSSTAESVALKTAKLLAASGGVTEALVVAEAEAPYVSTTVTTSARVKFDGTPTGSRALRFGDSRG